MPNWKKLIVSGSDATLNSLDVLSSVTASTVFVEDLLSIADGTKAAPSLHFKDDTDTGIYRYADNKLAISVGGTEIFRAEAAGIFSTGNVYTGNTGQFRNYGGVWKATTGLSGGDAKFILNGKTIMHLDEADERVGINTETPESDLEVVGDIRIKNANGANPTDAGSLIFAETGGVWGSTMYGFRVNSDGSANVLKFQGGSTTFTKDILTLTRDTGRVGIGTNSPTTTLQVEGTAFINTGVLKITKDAVTNYYEEDKMNSYGTFYDWQFAGNHVMRIKSDGKVGIGTSSPDATLHVESIGVSASGRTYHMIVDDNNAYGINEGGGIIFRGDYNAATAKANFAAIKAGKANANDGNANAYLAFMYGASGTLTEGLRIDYNGKIGIGTTSPSSKFQVSADDGDGITLKHGTSNAFYILRDGNDDTIIKQTRNYTSKISISTLADSGTHDSSGLNIVGQGSSLKSNVGIGTADPSAKLTVSGVANGSSIAEFKNANDIVKAKIGLASNSSGELTLIDGNNNSNVLLSSRTTTNSYVNAGNFGVGTTSPSTKLEVAGIIHASGSYLRTSNDATDSVGLSLQSPSTGVNVNFDFEVGDTDIGGLHPKNLVIRGSSSASDIAFSPSTTYPGLLMLDGSTGKVGIGDTSPTRELTVNGDIGVKNSGKIYLWDSHDLNYIQYDKWTTSASAGMTITNQASTGNLSLQTVSTTRLFVSASGNVGIGTTSPNYKLAVAGKSYLSGGIQMNSGDEIDFGNSNQYITGVNDTSLTLATGGSATLTATHAGNVGIGTTTPYTKLTVAGNITTTANSHIISTRKITARDGNGLAVYNDGGEGIDIKDDNTVTLTDYGSGTNTGTLAYAIGVDSTGNIVEYSGGTGGSVSSITNGADNRVATFSGTDSLNGEERFTFDGNSLFVSASAGSTATIEGPTQSTLNLKTTTSSKSNYIVGTTSGTISLRPGGVTSTTLLESGNVGINVTNPVRKLVVNGQTQFYDYSGATLTNVAHSNFLFDSLVNHASSTSGGGIGAYLKLSSAATNATGTYNAIRTRAYAENTTTNTEELINFYAEYRNYTSTSSVNLEKSTGLKVGQLGIGGSATVTNNYGIYLDPGTNATNNYGIYQVGASVDNYIQGNVGIGQAASTSKKLIVSGNASVSGEMFFSHFDNISSSSRMRDDLALWFGTNRKLGIKYNSTEDQLQFISGSNANMVMEPNGNIGIGTTNPDTSLEIFKEQDGDFLGLKVTKLHSNTYEYYTEYGNNQIKFSGNQSFVMYNASNRVADFHDGETNFYGNGGTLLMNITGSGQVGIGVSSPVYKLDVDLDSATDRFNITREGTQKFYVNGNGNTVTYGTLTSYGNTLGGGGGTFNYRGGVTNAAIGHRFMHVNNGSFEASSGEQIMMEVIPTIDQSSTAGYTGIKLNVTETATGSGDKNLLDLQVGGSSKYKVNSAGDLTMAGDLVVSGTVTAEEFHTEYVSSSIIYQSGSTKFGDTADDIHSFTGSLKVYGPTSGKEVSINEISSGKFRFNSTQIGAFMDVGPSNMVDFLGQNLRATQRGAYFDSSLGSATPLQVGTNGFYIESGSYNVGIGTTSPGYKLEVHGDTSASHRLRVVNASTGQSSVDLKTSQQETRLIAVNNKPFYVYDQTAGSELFTILSNGKVGIGNNTPSEKLDIAGNLLTRGDIVSRDTYPSIYVDHSGTVMGGIRADATTKLELKTLTTAPLSFQVNSSQKMLITNSGNVGIGTNSPSSKLHVEGDVQLGTGAATDDNSLTIYGNNGTASRYIKLIHHNASSSSIQTNNTYLSISAANYIVLSNNTLIYEGVKFSNDKKLEYQESDNSYFTAFNVNSSNLIQIGSVTGVSSGGDTAFYHNGTEKMRLESSKLELTGNLDLLGDAKHVYFGGTNTYIGENSNSNKLELRGGGSTSAQTVYIDNNGRIGLGTSSPETPIHIYATDTGGIKSQYGQVLIEHTDAQLDLLSTHSGTWGSAINFIEADGSNTNKDIWSIVRQTTDGSGDSSLRFNYGTGNNHQNVLKFKIDSAGNLSSTGGISVGDSTADTLTVGQKHILGYCENTDVDTGTEDVKTLPLTTYQAVFFDFLVKNGTNLRAGTLTAVHNGTDVEYNEVSTVDLGDTSGIKLQVVIDGSNLVLQATTLTDNWAVKSKY